MTLHDRNAASSPMPDDPGPRRDIVLLTLARDAPDTVVRAAASRLGVQDDRIAYACRVHEPGRVSVRLGGPHDPAALEAVARLPGIVRTMAAPGDLSVGAGTRSHAAPVALGHGVTLGRSQGPPTVMAGPCSVESEAQILEIAAAVKDAGAEVLRGGVFKPRTSPYTFGGLGPAGLELLALAGEQTRMPVVTEALQIDDVDAVARFADMIQIGSRNMQNYPLLFRAGSHPSGTPVLLKRGFGATIDELVQAAEYVLLGRAFAGIDAPGLILCERGIRTFETATRFTLDLAAIAILHERTPLPVIVDPSHAAGSRRLVPPLSRAAAAAGADGLLIEVHGDPDRAWSDGAQCLTLDAFAALMTDLRGAPHRPSESASVL